MISKVPMNDSYIIYLYEFNIIKASYTVCNYHEAEFFMQKFDSLPHKTAFVIISDEL